MATEEKVAPGSDWHIPVRTTAGEVWLEGKGRVHKLLQAIDMHGKTDRHMKLLTIEKESRGYTLGSRTVYTGLL